MSITNEALRAKLDEQEADCEEYGNYESWGFESQVQEVAEAIQEIHQEAEDPFEFSFSWEGKLEAGVTGALVSVYMGDFVYLSRYVEMKHLTNDREATGEAQAFAIKDALMDAYDDVVAFISKNQIRKGH